jgi:dipeptidyl-peptidase-4
MPRSVLIALAFFVLLPTGWSDQPVPPLSLDTIYHPQKRHKYLDSPAPATRWIEGDDGSPQLLIRREQGWTRHDPWSLLDPDSGVTDPPNDATGNAAEVTEGEDESSPEPVWPGVETLVRQLMGLGDVDEPKARGIVDGWIGSSEKSLRSSLVRIDNSIAIAGLEQTPRWVTRQAGQWDDPMLSPDGSRVAFVQDNDLYVMTIRTQQLIRITDDGSPTRLNGRLDWVYQEELYGRGNFAAFWWADDSRSLAFLRLDNSRVHPFTFTTSDGPRGGTEAQRYPKAGDPSTSAELWVATLGDELDSSVSLTPVFTPQTVPSSYDPDNGVAGEPLIVRVGWRPVSGELIFVQTNRVQNELTLWRYDVRSAGRSGSGQTGPSVILRERCDQWLEVIGLPRWLPDGDFLWLSDLPSGRRRLWRISGDAARRAPLTPEGFDVRELAAVNADTLVAFVTGDLQRGTIGQQLYRISIEPEYGTPMAGPPRPMTRMTGELPWHNVSLCENQAWMVDRASGLTQPTVMSLVQIGDPAGKPGLGISVDPTDLANGDGPLASRELHRERLNLPGPAIEPNWVTISTDDGVDLPAYVFPPAGAVGSPQSAASSGRFPVLIEVYGGPLAPSVRDSFASSRYLFHQLLASQGIGVMVVDNRSSGGRGLADAWSIHRRVGEVETRDLVAAAQWLKSNAWVDGDRVAVRGWSFGGFLTLHAMTHSDMFAAGVAGGSVTDWRNYDSIYTERYMGLPTENVSGYDSTSPLKAADKIHGRVLLLHGEVDDNVHLSNTLQMTAALQNAGKRFDLMIYPGSAHGVNGGMPVYHLMTTTMEFLERELIHTRAGEAEIEVE